MYVYIYIYIYIYVYILRLTQLYDYFVSILSLAIVEQQYTGADKSLAPPARKQANVSVRMARISSGALPCSKKKIDDSSRLDVIEIASVSDMLPRLFPSWSG